MAWVWSMALLQRTGSAVGSGGQCQEAGRGAGTDLVIIHAISVAIWDWGREWRQEQS